jgi:hypothetical protein
MDLLLGLAGGLSFFLFLILVSQHYGEKQGGKYIELAYKPYLLISLLLGTKDPENEQNALDQLITFLTEKKEDLHWWVVYLEVITKSGLKYRGRFYPPKPHLADILEKHKEEVTRRQLQTQT